VRSSPSPFAWPLTTEHKFILLSSLGHLATSLILLFIHSMSSSSLLLDVPSILVAPSSMSVHEYECLCQNTLFTRMVELLVTMRATAGSVDKDGCNTECGCDEEEDEEEEECVDEEMNSDESVECSSGDEYDAVTEWDGDEEEGGDGKPHGAPMVADEWIEAVYVDDDAKYDC
jgi:hypothetical protein